MRKIKQIYNFLFVPDMGAMGAGCLNQIVIWIIILVIIVTIIKSIIWKNVITHTLIQYGLIFQPTNNVYYVGLNGKYKQRYINTGGEGFKTCT